jgi:Fe-S oxidoreductase
MLRGDAIGGGWKSEEVKEALDLCLACKACKTECPAAVDMATYKAEFLSRYYEGRRRPRTALLFGRVHRWARRASKLPGAANFLTQTPGLSRLARAAAGIDPRRPIPRLASRTFRSWFRGRAPGGSGDAPVLLWVDTFTDYFRPEIGRSAVEVLEAAGFRVEIPPDDLCCGRPLYDFGMLAEAQHLLRGALVSLREPLRSGRRVVVLEPSCAAVFRDEAVNLFPDDEDARRLAAQTRLLGEFLAAEAPGLAPPGARRRALVLTHCHQQALFGRAGDEILLGRIGLDAQFLDAGCCGMAGAFGFERGEHYDVSRRCAERVLAPAVRQAPPDALILADGFSCREQILHTTGRAAIHLAQAVHGRIAPAPRR